MKRIEKSWSDLDLDRVDFARGWSWGIGGHPLMSDEYSVSETNDGVVTRYKLPAFVGEMMHCARNSGKHQAQERIRSALGIQGGGT